MKRILFAICVALVLGSGVFAQFTFYLIDNFENGEFAEGSKWWRFGNMKVEITRNSTPEARDIIAESCGNYSLALFGQANNWYVGGIGTELGVDAAEFSRFQIDISGDKELHGKLIIELFDDDNNNFTIEQDPQKNYEPVFDDKWVAEVNIQGKGFTRTSIPFTAFRDVNPGIGNDTWDPFQKNGSGGLLKLQMVLIADQQSGRASLNLDNILLTY
ncbi:MAG: hypothetical protein WCT39_02550 [Candidatus Margulisiibacteriota bacterium]